VELSCCLCDPGGRQVHAPGASAANNKAQPLPSSFVALVRQATPLLFTATRTYRTFHQSFMAEFM
jgi:hypothetical protein